MPRLAAGAGTDGFSLVVQALSEAALLNPAGPVGAIITKFAVTSALIVVPRAGAGEGEFVWVRQNPWQLSVAAVRKGALSATRAPHPAPSLSLATHHATSLTSSSVGACKILFDSHGCTNLAGVTAPVGACASPNPAPLASFVSHRARARARNATAVCLLASCA